MICTGCCLQVLHKNTCASWAQKYTPTWGCKAPSPTQIIHTHNFHNHRDIALYMCLGPFKSEGLGDGAHNLYTLVCVVYLGFFPFFIVLKLHSFTSMCNSAFWRMVAHSNKLHYNNACIILQHFCNCQETYKISSTIFWTYQCCDFRKCIVLGVFYKLWKL